MKKMILAAGGTAGHVFPACALSVELRKRGFFTILITDKRGEKFVQNEFDRVIVLPISRFNWKFFLFSPFLFLRAVIEVFKAEKVVSFGGYISFFPVLAAIFLLKKFFIVQLDSVITRLNRWFIPYASKVFYLFPQTNFEKYGSHLVLSGIPLRSGFEFSFIKHDPENFVIAVLGGSLGSNYWKDLIFQFAKNLDVGVRKKLTLFIQTGEEITFLEGFDFKYLFAQSFFDTKQLLRKSHLVITRCGANTLAEIAAVGRPAFLVPWEKAIENHQVINAKNLLEFGGCSSGGVEELTSYFLKLFENENFFVSECSKFSSIFEFNGKQFVADSLK